MHTSPRLICSNGSDISQKFCFSLGLHSSWVHLLPCLWRASYRKVSLGGSWLPRWSREWWYSSCWVYFSATLPKVCLSSLNLYSEIFSVIKFSSNVMIFYSITCQNIFHYRCRVATGESSHSRSATATCHHLLGGGLDWSNSGQNWRCPPGIYYIDWWANEFY